MVGWTTKAIGSVTTIINGGTPKSGVEEYWDGVVLWITPKDMGQLKSDYVSDTSRKISEKGLSKSSAKMIPANSVILSTRAPIGHLAINTVPMATNQGCRGLAPIETLDTKYLFYFLRLNVALLNDLGSGTTFKELSKGALSGVQIPLPPLSEQKRIVAILDEAFAGIDAAVANTEKNLANARELFESYLNAVFTRKGDGWVDKKLGECFRLRSGDGLTSKAMIAGGYKVYGGNGIAGTHNQFNLTGENVIIGRVGALCGNARHIRESIWLTDNAFKVVDQKYKFDNAFLAYLLNFKNLRIFARQSAQPVISNSSLKDIELYFPEFEVEQQLIVERLDSLKCESNNLESIYQQKLAALAELKQSILQKAFAGELTSLPETTVEEAI